MAITLLTSFLTIAMFVVQFCWSKPSIVIEPTFISPGIISKTFNPLALHKESPFYSNEQQIYTMVELFIKKNQANKALDMLRLVVSSERKWRLEICLQAFGSCNGNAGNAAPFFIWKKKFTHKLLLNPTKEIIAKVGKNVGFKLLTDKMIKQRQ